MKKAIKRCMLFIIVCFVCMVAEGCGTDTISISESEDIKSSEDTMDLSETAVVTEDTSDKIVVYVCGAVAYPGVYELESGARVNDALEAAGGFSDEADCNVINLAEDVFDGERIYFPVQGEKQNQENVADQTSPYDDSHSSGLVNINEAGVSELTDLPGIGETRAGQIVEYRQTYGRFASKEDLKNVSGIGDSTYKKLEEYITVD